MPARVPRTVGALACALALTARAQDPAHAPAPGGFDAAPDPAFEPQAFLLFASNKGAGTGRHTAVTLSGHGRVVSLAPYACAFVLDQRFRADTPPYQVAVAVEIVPGNPF